MNFRNKRERETVELTVIPAVRQAHKMDCTQHPYTGNANYETSTERGKSKKKFRAEQMSSFLCSRLNLGQTRLISSFASTTAELSSQSKRVSVTHLPFEHHFHAAQYYLNLPQ